MRMRVAVIAACAVTLALPGAALAGSALPLATNSTIGVDSGSSKTGGQAAVAEENVARPGDQIEKCALNGGVFVAAADCDGDGRADIITGAGPGAGPSTK